MFNPLTADKFCFIFIRREGKVFFPYPLSTLSLTVSIQNACLFLPNSFHSILYLCVRTSGLKKKVSPFWEVLQYFFMLER